MRMFIKSKRHLTLLDYRTSEAGFAQRGRVDAKFDLDRK